MKALLNWLRHRRAIKARIQWIDDEARAERVRRWS
jgi:hypothetical protein